MVIFETVEQLNDGGVGRKGVVEADVDFNLVLDSFFQVFLFDVVFVDHFESVLVGGGVAFAQSDLVNIRRGTPAQLA